MKDSGWIIIRDFDNSHQELLQDFTDVLNEMGISVSYNQIDDVVKIEIEKSKNDSTSL